MATKDATATAALSIEFRDDDAANDDALVALAHRGAPLVASLTLTAAPSKKAQDALRDALAKAPRASETLHLLDVAGGSLVLERDRIAPSLVELVVRTEEQGQEDHWGGSALVAAPRYRPYLQHLSFEPASGVLPSLRVVELRANSVAGLGALVAGCPALEVLRVGAKASTSSTLRLDGVLARLPATLRELSADGAMLTDASTLAALSHCTALRTLRLSAIQGSLRSLDGLPTAVLERLSIVCDCSCGLDLEPDLLSAVRGAAKLLELEVVHSTGRVRLDVLHGAAFQATLRTFVWKMCSLERDDADDARRFLSACSALVHVSSNVQRAFDYASSAPTLETVTHDATPCCFAPSPNGNVAYSALRVLRLRRQRHLGAAGLGRLDRLARSCPALELLAIHDCDASFTEGRGFEPDAWPALRHLEIRGGHDDECMRPTFHPEQLVGHAAIGVVRLRTVRTSDSVVRLRDLPELRTLELDDVAGMSRLELDVPALRRLSLGKNSELLEVVIRVDASTSCLDVDFGSTQLRLTERTGIADLAVMQEQLEYQHFMTLRVIRGA